MKKKVLAIVLTVVMVATLCTALCVGLTACNNDPDFKVGFIFLHGESSTYDKNFMDAAKDVQRELGLKDSQVIFKVNIEEEGDACYNAAADLVDQGCDVIFADSFGHEDNMLRAAREFTNVQFCHATGVKAHTENVANFHNAFASIYEGRYLAGIAAGMKLNEMIANNSITAQQAKIGYVGAKPYAEVKSGYTSFFLGARSVCESVTMEVTFTGEWYDEIAEKNAANNLIARGCKLISQHADSWGAPNACELAGVPNISYNGSTISNCPNTFIVSSKINWAPYFKYMIQSVQNGTAIDADWTGTLATGSVELSDINTTAAAAGTAEAIAEAKAQLEAGTLHVFDTSKFTVSGPNFNSATMTVDANNHLTAYNADVNSDAAFAPDTQVVADGQFKESYYRSAPYFDITIDGITLLN